MQADGFRQVQVSGTEEGPRSPTQAEAGAGEGGEAPPCTDENDYQIKLRNLKRFLEEGDKCKVTLRFRGREMAHQEFGLRQLERVKADLEELGQVEQMPKMEGRQMIMVIAPKKNR